jgi:GNAT superfamily N-acetyltransferase
MPAAERAKMRVLYGGELHMIGQAVEATLGEIQPFRALFLQETNFQIRYDACHVRGWTDSYLLKIDDVPVGYGSIKGLHREDRDSVFEFYIIPPFRRWSRALFTALIAAAEARLVECQSNDALLSSMLYEFAHDINADTVLFEDHDVTHHEIEGALVRRARDDDRIFEHTVEPVGDFVLEIGDEIVATAGFTLHYNLPFADLYMEVRPDCRDQGFGSYILQEVKKACYLSGRVPAARCGIGNAASRATLIKAGLSVCGYMLIGKVKRNATAVSA